MNVASGLLFRATPALLALYAIFVSLLAIPLLQRHVIYLHGITLTWFQDVNIPEQWGFLPNQVTPFHLKTPDGEMLHAWHILPLELYRQNQNQLQAEPTGLSNDITCRTSFSLLRDDPEALLVLYLHGAAGTLGSGYRPPSYRALSGLAPSKIHVLAIDYRGFGSSTGTPSEEGLLADALALVDFAMNVAGVPASRIVVFSQSIGTAVATKLVSHLARHQEGAPVFFAGLVLVAPFADVETLTGTYRVAGTVPILGPVAYFPKLLKYLNSFIVSKWWSKDEVAGSVRACHAFDDEVDVPTYHVSIFHAEDDYDIPWQHSDTMYWHAVNASLPLGISYEELSEKKAARSVDLGHGGRRYEHRTRRGLVRETILRHGLHDRIMSYPIVSLAVYNAFEHAKTHP